jgi:hypothetical protein
METRSVVGRVILCLKPDRGPHKSGRAVLNVPSSLAAGGGEFDSNW